MTMIQRDIGSPSRTREVWYDGAGGQMVAGYAVCYDEGEGLTPSAGEFSELRRYTVVQKPETANLQFFAGICVDPLQQKGTTAGKIIIAEPTRGAPLQALCKVNATIGDPLTVTNGQWWLVADADAGTATTGAGAPVFSRKTFALAGETANTSSTEANKTIVGL